MAEQKIITLIGMKHCGKTSAGEILAKKLALPFADTDALIKDTAGKTARELFLEGGAALMAKAEAEACTEALKRSEGGGIVISTGGAFCENGRAVTLLRPMSIFCLIEADFDVLYRRVLKSAEEEGEMPAFLRGENPKERFYSIYIERMEKYKAMADIAVKSSEESAPEETADAIIRQLAPRAASPRR